MKEISKCKKPSIVQKYQTQEIANSIINQN